MKESLIHVMLNMPDTRNHNVPRELRNAFVLNRKKQGLKDHHKAPHRKPKPQLYTETS